MSIHYPRKESYNVEDLRRIVEHLRSEDGCPWDREQTHESIRQDLLEETYEAAEAIDLNDKELLKEELGDVLLQVVFHARMEEEEGGFDLDAVADGICRKLITRHPHVFADISVEGTDEVLVNWEKIKQESKGQTTQAEAVKSVPKTFPALMRAQKVQKRAGKAGFDYPDAVWCMDDLEDALDNLHLSMEEEDKAACEKELGNVLFSLVNVARKLELNAEQALTKATERYIRRFEQVEKLAVERGIKLDPDMTGVLMDLWNDAKERDDHEPDSEN